MLGLGWSAARARAEGPKGGCLPPALILLEESRGHTPIPRDPSLPAGSWRVVFLGGGVNLKQFGAKAEAVGPCVFGLAPYSTLLMTSTSKQHPASLPSIRLEEDRRVG